MNTSQKEALDHAKKSSYFLSLASEDQRTLFLILLSVLYGERCLVHNGKKYVRRIENCLEKLKIKRFVCSTLGIWNFNACHAQRFGYKEKEFRAILEQPQMATEIVMRHFVEDIGLKKTPELIFAEYNHNIMATSVAALQKALNVLSSSRLLEDGLIGPGTVRALEICSDYLPDFFSLDRINEEMVLHTLDHLEAVHGICFKPCVPEVVIKKDLRFIGSVLIQSLKDFRKIKRLRAFFERDIDIPRYVKDCMRAFTLLTQEERF